MMQPVPVIMSAENKAVKEIGALQQKKYRAQSGSFLVEGLRSVAESLTSGWPLEYLVYTENFCKQPKAAALLAAAEAGTGNVQPVRKLLVSEAVYRKISATETPQGVLAVVKKKETRLPDLLAGKASKLLVVMDGIQDPGNAGTIIRTADAAGCSGVIALKGCVDLFAPKTLRATMGSIFHVPVLEGETAQIVVAALAAANIAFFVAAPDAQLTYYDADFSQSSAVFLGNEANGITAELCAVLPENNYARINIPLHGQAESLNVAMAAAVILYEAVRQRR